jgi:DNA-binding response OmpR family regulator
MSATVLCVHEDAAMARVHAETLEAEGYEVLCARDGRQAFEILRERHPDFAVIDAYLPRQDGFEILAEMRSQEGFRAMPVLILSEGDITEELSARASELGAVGIEPSPLAGPRLVECVAAFLKQSIEVDGAEADESMRSELAEFANRVRNRDHYGVLDVPTTANDDEIRIAFACLSKRTHPDRFHAASHSVRQLAEQVFGRVANAHAAISTASNRDSYANELARGRRDEAAEEEGRRALAAETEFQKGEAKMVKRDYEGALLCFGRAMENFPAEGEYRSNYGWCLYLCHPDNDVMLGEALEHCREGLKLAKDREKPYLLLGRLYKAVGKPGAAKKMFSRAVQIKPQCVEAMRELRILNMRRDKNESLGKGVFKRIFRR